jgi:hypothetical protein
VYPFFFGIGVPRTGIVVPGLISLYLDWYHYTWSNLVLDKRCKKKLVVRNDFNHPVARLYLNWILFRYLGDVRGALRQLIQKALFVDIHGVITFAIRLRTRYITGNHLQLPSKVAKVGSSLTLS